MSDIIERTFKCTGCGDARPCTLTTTQAKAEIAFFDPAESLECVLDKSNKTAHNWKEVQANGADKSAEPALHKHIVSHRTFNPNDTEVEDMAVQIDQFINQHALAKPGTYSRKLREFLANKLNEYGG